jgi:hypothetical protein
MTKPADLAVAQLGRMRAMNAKYHARFFADIRYSITASLALFVSAAALDGRLLALIPLVAVIGAAQTAFDASYLIFSRQYATRLERWLNQELSTEVLVANRLEEAYLFPLDKPKVVTLAWGSGFTWFGFMTAFYTVIGASVFVVGLVGGAGAIASSNRVFSVAYVLAMAVITLLTLGAGWWWFLGGVGERRLRQILDETFPPV